MPSAGRLRWPCGEASGREDDHSQTCKDGSLRDSWRAPTARRVLSASHTGTHLTLQCPWAWYHYRCSFQTGKLRPRAVEALA